MLQFIKWRIGSHTYYYIISVDLICRFDQRFPNNLNFSLKFTTRIEKKSTNQIAYG